MARKLCVLDFVDLSSMQEVEDREASLRRQYGKHLDVSVIHEWYRAQEILASRGSKPVRPDAIIFDIAFSKDGSLGEGQWRQFRDDQEPLKPVGPLLVLPFMNSRDVVSLVPYSSLWREIKADWDPMLYTALGLIVARVQRQASTWSELPDAMSRVEEHAAINTAVLDAVRAYRDELEQAIAEQDVTVLPGVSDVIEFLTRLKEATAKGLVRFDPEDKRYQLCLRFSQGEDTILLGSIFADKLIPTLNEVGSDVIVEMLDWLNQLPNLEEEWNDAVNVLKEVEKARSNKQFVGRELKEGRSGKRAPRRRNGFNEAILRACGLVAGRRLGSLRRTCIVLAHVAAAKLLKERGGTLKTEVMDILGLGEYNTYLDLFGARTKNSKPEHADLFQPGDTFFIGDQTQLKLAERHYCQWYAEYRMRWNEKNQWPVWMQ